MTPDEIIAAALARGGFDSYANGSFREGLEILCRTIPAVRGVPEERLSSLYRVMVGHLYNRFRIEHYLAEHPALRDVPIKGPVFVMGMPRTGTTLTVNLLAQDAETRTPRKWELTDPIPPAAAGMLNEDPRCKAMNAQREADVASGKLKTNVHFEWAQDPTECVFMLAEDFKSAMWDAYLPKPEYSEFLLICDMLPAYRWHREVLLALQANNRGRWTLKAPSHAMWVEALLEVYPDARIVWTHRDPKVAVASMCSLVEGAHRRFAPAADLDWIGSFYPRQLVNHVRPMLDLSRRHPERVSQVLYDDLVDEPVRAVDKIYRDLGMTLTSETEAAVRKYVEDNPRGKHGEHSYDLEKYGIDERRIDRLFADYYGWIEENRAGIKV